MALTEDTFFGEVDKVAISIDRLRTFEPPEGYYLAFSGGKDSQTIYHLAKEAGVKFDAHYNVTTVDPPELIYFIRDNYPDVKFEYSGTTMWKLIPKKMMPPTRLARYCCETLKEHGGEGRICLTGVRWEESVKRKLNRSAFEASRNLLFNDNVEGRRLFESCALQGKRVINPIIDWSLSDVWDYLNSRGLPHCRLYDEGFERIGCIGCPMAGPPGMAKEFARWPKYYNSYSRAFAELIAERNRRGREGAIYFTSPESIMKWWIHGKYEEQQIDGQLTMEAEDETED